MQQLSLLPRQQPNRTQLWDAFAKTHQSNATDSQGPASAAPLRTFAAVRQLPTPTQTV
jgi:hypothetical protein